MKLSIAEITRLAGIEDNRDAAASKDRKASMCLNTRFTETNHTRDFRRTFFCRISSFVVPPVACAILSSRAPPPLTCKGVHGIQYVARAEFDGGERVVSGRVFLGYGPLESRQASPDRHAGTSTGNAISLPRLADEHGR